MKRSVPATTKPLIEAAATCAPGTFQTNSARTTATRYEIGIALLAGHLSPTRNTATAIIGNNDKKANIPVLINYISPFFRNIHNIRSSDDFKIYYIFRKYKNQPIFEIILLN